MRTGPASRVAPNASKTHFFNTGNERERAVRTTISKTWTFDAAHRIPHHSGKCANEHGHTYRVTVEVSGPVQPVDGRSSGGMVIDFYDLSLAWKLIEPELDHRDLNKTLEGRLEATTSELLAGYLFEHFSVKVNDLSPGIQVTAVEVSETPSSSARVTL